jgi:hypothetical protein
MVVECQVERTDGLAPTVEAMYLPILHLLAFLPLFQHGHIGILASPFPEYVDCATDRNQ